MFDWKIADFIPSFLNLIDIEDDNMYLFPEKRQSSKSFLFILTFLQSSSNVWTARFVLFADYGVRSH